MNLTVQNSDEISKTNVWILFQIVGDPRCRFTGKCLVNSKNETVTEKLIGSFFKLLCSVRQGCSLIKESPVGADMIPKIAIHLFLSLTQSTVEQEWLSSFSQLKLKWNEMKG